MGSFLKWASFAALLLGISAVASAASFLETLAWVNQQNGPNLGTPGGFDIDPYGNTISFSANYDGSATSCNFVNLGLGDTEWGSSSFTFTGQATANFCRWTPGSGAYAVGTYDDYGDSVPQALFLAQFNNLGNFISETNFYVPNQTAQIPMAWIRSRKQG